MQQDDAEDQRCKRLFEASQRFVDSVDPLRIRLRVGASDGVGSTFRFGAFIKSRIVDSLLHDIN